MYTEDLVPRNHERVFTSSKAHAESMGRVRYIYLHLDVSKNSGTPKSSILIGVFHYFHHPFWGTILFGNTHLFLFFMVN